MANELFEKYPRLWELGRDIWTDSGAEKVEPTPDFEIPAELRSTVETASALLPGFATLPAEVQEAVMWGVGDEQVAAVEAHQLWPLDETLLEMFEGKLAGAFESQGEVVAEEQAVEPKAEEQKVEEEKPS